MLKLYCCLSVGLPNQLSKVGLSVDRLAGWPKQGIMQAVSAGDE